MKRLLPFFAVLSVLTVSADERSAEILDKLSNIISNSGNYRIDFISTVEGHSMEGYYIVSGENYRIHTPRKWYFLCGRHIISNRRHQQRDSHRACTRG